MSDLAVPFIALMDDDALAFACFSAVMARARHNFAVDESGIFAQLRALSGLLAVADRVLEHRLRALGAAECHFAYRMIVVLMRRDLPLGQVGLGRHCLHRGRMQLFLWSICCPRDANTLACGGVAVVLLVLWAHDAACPGVAAAGHGAVGDAVGG